MAEVIFIIVVGILMVLFFAVAMRIPWEKTGWVGPFVIITLIASIILLMSY